MWAETSNHTPATFQEQSGFRLNGFPTIGAWMSYGLGNDTDNLPTYVVIPDTRGLPASGSINWTNGFLPARHQGVVIRSRGIPIDDLQPARPIDERTELASRALLRSLNEKHLRQSAPAGLADVAEADLAKVPGHDALVARIRSYELAAKMQLAVPEVADLAAETAATQADYGLNDKATVDFGRGCLLARRLLERGVRFIQMFSGGAFEKASFLEVKMRNRFSSQQGERGNVFLRTLTLAWLLFKRNFRYCLARKRPKNFWYN